MDLAETLWRTLDAQRSFIIPDGERWRTGALPLRSVDGEERSADAAWAARFEVSRAEARAWAQEEFGFVLSQLRRRIDARLARARASARRAPEESGAGIAPDAVPAVLDLIRKLPGAIVDSLSGDPVRLEHANGDLLEVQQRLGAAGVDVAPGLSAFPERLAALRRDFTARGSAGDNAPPS